jgi:hypothetical protein
MLRTAAQAVADRRSYDLISVTAVWSGRRPDRAVAAESARRRRGSGAEVIDRCRRGVLARRDNDVGDGGSGAVWEASAGGSQTESFDLLMAWRNGAPGGVKIDLPEGDADEGSGRLRGSKSNLMPCRKNRLHIIIDCIALCLSASIYKGQESWGARHLWIHMVVYNT